MTHNKNNIPVYEEQIIIEQTAEEEIADLREKLKVLQEELTEKEEENEELDKLVWKGIEKLNKKEEEERKLKTSLNNFRSKLLGSLFKNKQKDKKVTEINNSLSFLRGLLTEKKQEAINLTNERNNRPNITHQEYNNLVQERDNIQNQLTAANNLITNIQNLLGINDLNNLPPLPEGETLTSLLARPASARLNELERKNNDLQLERNNMQTQRDERPNITLFQWNNDYSRRPTQQQLNNIQQELDKEKGWWDKAAGDWERGIVNEGASICSCSSYNSLFHICSGGTTHYVFNSDEIFDGRQGDGGGVRGKFVYCRAGLEWLKEARKKYL